MIAYACLLKSSGQKVNEIPADEITLSFVRDAFPREMVRIVTAGGAAIKQEYPGIYYLSQQSNGVGQVLFPTQIIVTGELENSTHSSLRILTNCALEDDVRRFLYSAMTETNQGDQSNVDSILQVSVSANIQVYEKIRRDSAMCQALRELMKDEIQKDVDAARAEGIHAVVDVYRADMGLDD